MDQKGYFIAIEGTDGSGKGTQVTRLVEKLRAAGYDVVSFDFPQYSHESSYFVKQYLNGQYGTANDIGPYTGSLFYALDRYEAAPKIRQALNDNKIVVANRYTGSNMAHQGTKFDYPEERRGYFIWLDNLEFEMLKIPRPDVNLVLRVPAEIAQTLVDQKDTRSYTTRTRDIHEADINHLQRSVEVYDDLCQLFPKDFVRIDCVRSDQLLSIDDVSHLIWERVQPMLPARNTPLPPDIAEPAQTEAMLKKEGERFVITRAGQEYLEKAITDTTGNVYAFTSYLSPVTIAAAMARLSRRGDDMRVTLLDEFAGAAGKDEKLLERVISAYGDDSVQQLAGIHVVVENASNLLTKKLEWGRLAAYLEQSTRYIYFDTTDSKGNYKYYVPTTFDVRTAENYKKTMNQLFELYSKLVHGLTEYVQANSAVPEKERDGAWKAATRAQACDAARPVLPVATTSTVGIFASGQALESLIMHLLGDRLSEASQTGEDILVNARKVVPAFLERADKPDRGGAIIAYRANTYSGVDKLVKEYLKETYTQDQPAVTLSDYWPKNELDIIADIIYEHSNLSLSEIHKLVNQWPYDRKIEMFNAYMGERLNRRHRPGRALEKVHYSWDLICDYGIFRDLQRHRIVDDLEWQMLTPRYGYDVPDLVEKADLSELFEQCFDISLKLHGQLQNAGYELESQYATLLGHKMRWKVTYNAREAFHLHELRTSPQGHPGYRKLIQQMHDKLAEVHPLMAESMNFVNQGEDPELTRLAAERYTQFKLTGLQ